MFSMHDFLMDCLHKAVNEQPESWTMDRAKAWFTEGYLAEVDLAQIDAEIKAKHPAEVIPEEVSNHV